MSVIGVDFFNILAAVSQFHKMKKIISAIGVGAHIWW
jgi:hypothetical protein